LIPEGWKDCTVGDLVKFAGGSQPPKSTFIREPRDGYVRLIQIRDYKTNEYPTYVPRHLAKKFCDSQDIMIGRYGPPLFKILRGLEGAYNVALIKAIPRRGIDREYLYYFFTQGDIARYLETLSQRTGGQTGIEMDRLKKYPLPLPPLPEQRAIAAILSTWDEAITLTEWLIAALQDRKRGLMQRLLTGEVRFPKFEGEEWHEMRLGDFLKMELRKVEKPQDAYLRLGIRSHGKGTFLSDIEDPDSVAMTHLYEVREGDLIVSITFAWEGAIALVGPDGNGALVSHRFPTFVFNAQKVLPEFFKYLMLTDRFFYDLGLISPGGAGRNRVMSKRDFQKLRVKVPSVLEQKKIGSLLSAVDDYIDALSEYLEQLQHQKKGLMQRLLTGEIRVRED
jgi:type I restriction enzyme S subunit